MELAAFLEVDQVALLLAVDQQHGSPPATHRCGLRRPLGFAPDRERDGRVARSVSAQNEQMSLLRGRRTVRTPGAMSVRSASASAKRSCASSRKRK